MSTAFCPTCRTMREVMDEYETDTGDRYMPGPRTYQARPLECGHDAGDGGGLPPRRRPIDDRAVKQRLIELQEGAK
jgi:hypothetical protein